MGPLGRKRVAGENELHGHGGWQGAGQPEEPAGGRDQRAFHLRQAERRRGGRHDEIARQRDLAPPGQRGAIDGGKERLDPIAPGDAGEAATLGRQRQPVPGSDGLEIGARREHRSLGAHDTDPHLAVALEPVQAGLHALGDVGADGVAGLRTADGDDRRASLLGVLDHGLSRRAGRGRRRRGTNEGGAAEAGRGAVASRRRAAWPAPAPAPRPGVRPRPRCPPDRGGVPGA